MPTPPRLETTAYRKLMKHASKDILLADFIRNTPKYMSTVQNAAIMSVPETISIQQSNLKYTGKRYVRLQLIQAIFTLFQSEPDAHMELFFPRKHVILSIWMEGGRHKKYIISITKNDMPWKEFTFWEKKDAVHFFMDVFRERLPKMISLQRSSIAMHEGAVNEFLRNVRETFQIENPTRQMINTYNRRTLQLSLSPLVSVF